MPAFDAKTFDIGGSPQHHDVVEAFDRQLPAIDRVTDGGEVAVNDGWVDHAPRPSGVPPEDGRGREVEHDRHDRRRGRPSAVQEWSAMFGLRVRGVDDGHLGAGETAFEGSVKDPECEGGGALVGLAAGDGSAQGVR